MKLQLILKRIENIKHWSKYEQFKRCFKTVRFKNGMSLHFFVVSEWNK